MSLFRLQEGGKEAPARDKFLFSIGFRSKRESIRILVNCDIKVSLSLSLAFSFWVVFSFI